jgi:WD40 repeat protein
LLLVLATLALASFAAGDVSRDGRLVLGGETYLSGGPLKHVTIWDLASGRVARVFSRAAWDPVFSPDGRLVVATASANSQGWQGPAVILDVASGSVKRSLHGSLASLMDPEFSPDGRLVVGLDGEPAVMEETNVGVWSVAAGQRTRTFECSSRPRDGGHCLGVDVSPDGRRLLASGLDAKARVWNLRSGRQLRVFSPHVVFGEGSDQAKTEARFSPNGRLVVVAADSGVASSVGVFDVETGTTRLNLPGATDPGFSPDGRLLATHRGGRTIEIHDVRSGRLLRSLHDARGAVGGLAFSRGGSHLLTFADASSSDPDVAGRFFRALRIWNVAQGTIQHTIETRFATGVYNPSGRLIVTIGPTLQVWDAVTGQLLRSLHP